VAVAGEPLTVASGIFAVGRGLPFLHYNRNVVTEKIKTSEDAASSVIKPPVPDVFFAAPTMEQLMESQGVELVQDISVFAGVIGDEEIADFVAGIYAARERA
jgi:hypothetical protein